MREGETREQLEAQIHSIHDYGEYMKSCIGMSYINEWGEFMAGPTYPHPVVCFNTEITRDSIKQLVDAMGDENPLYRDPDYAEKTKYGSLIAPPSWPFTIVYGQYPEFTMTEYVSLYCGDTFEWYMPVADGDKIDWKTTYPTEVFEKQTRVGGTAVFCKGMQEFKRHQGGVPVARQIWTQCYIEMEKTPYNTVRSGAKVPQYTPEFIEQIHAAWDEENEKLWGGKPHYFEDVTIGESLTPLVRGPLTASEVAAWTKAASQFFFTSNKLHLITQERSQWGYYDPALKMHMNTHENVYDCYGVMHERTGSYIPGGMGSQRCSWVCTFLSNFASDEGFVWKMDLRHVRKGGLFNVYTTTGTITDKHAEGGRFWVDIDLQMVDQTGEAVIKGKAQVLLPSREHGPVIYPRPSMAYPSFHA